MLMSPPKSLITMRRVKRRRTVIKRSSPDQPETALRRIQTQTRTQRRLPRTVVMANPWLSVHYPFSHLPRTPISHGSIGLRGTGTYLCFASSIFSDLSGASAGRWLVRGVAGPSNCGLHVCEVSKSRLHHPCRPGILGVLLRHIIEVFPWDPVRHFHDDRIVSLHVD